MKHPIFLSRQRGLSLLELLLGLVVIGAITAQALILQNRSTEQAAGRLQADQLASFQRVAAQYFLSNRDAMEAAMKGDATLAAKHCTATGIASSPAIPTCAFDTAFMKTQGLWPVGLAIETGNGGRYTAIFKYNATSKGTEMLVVLAAPTQAMLNAARLPVANLNQLYQTRDSIGAAGGFIPYGDAKQCAASKTLNRIEACGNGWSLDLTKFVSSAELDYLKNNNKLP